MSFFSFVLVMHLLGCNNQDKEDTAQNTNSCAWNQTDSSDFKDAPLPVSLQDAYNAIEVSSNTEQSNSVSKSKALYQCPEVEAYYIKVDRSGNDPYGYGWIETEHYVYNREGQLCEECSMEYSDVESEIGHCSLLDLDLSCQIVQEQ